jgi:hypothetical protein
MAVIVMLINGFREPIGIQPICPGAHRPSRAAVALVGSAVADLTSSGILRTRGSVFEAASWLLKSYSDAIALLGGDVVVGGMRGV